MTSRIVISFAALLALSPAATAQTVTTTTTTVETRALRLSPERRAVVYRTVMRERRVTPAPEIQVRVGAPVPREVELSAFPDETYVDVPVLCTWRTGSWSWTRRRAKSSTSSTNDEVTQATELSPLCCRLVADLGA